MKKKRRDTAQLSLHTFDEFMAHPWVQSLLDNYNQKDYNLAFYAIECILRDIQLINEEFEDQHGRSLILSASGRVKSENSTFKKLYDSCCSREKSKTLTRRQLKAFYGEIFDLAGVRFACPYYDQVIPAIECSIRSGLSERGYAVDLSAKPKMNDRNYLDAGDSHGYRAYHFFVKVPTPVDIYGEVEECLVEVQARTELQHVWAVKSHNLLYKPESGWQFSDDHVREDMRQVSNSLRAADQLLVSIRDRIRSEGK